MRNPFYLVALALAVNLFGTRFYATAQAVLPKASDGGGKGVDTNKVYDVVEQMPTLPNGGGFTAITAAVQQAAVVVAGEYVEGRVFVAFVVGRTGKVRDITILRAPSPALGKAVVAAVAKLPQLKPGMQNGEATNVRLQLTIAVSVKP